VFTKKSLFFYCPFTLHALLFLLLSFLSFFFLVLHFFFFPVHLFAWDTERVISREMRDRQIKSERWDRRGRERERERDRVREREGRSERERNREDRTRSSIGPVDQHRRAQRTPEDAIFLRARNPMRPVDPSNPPDRIWEREPVQPRPNRERDPIPRSISGDFFGSFP
jgi:hypothetical protein